MPAKLPEAAARPTTFLAPLLIAVLSVASPAALAGSADEPELEDGTGDARTYPGIPGSEPWVDGIDLVSLWVHDETESSVSLTFRMVDLAKVESAPVGSSPIWSYTDFTVSSPDGKTSDNYTLYFDYNNDPAYEKGWRFYLQDPEEVEVQGTVDMNASTLAVVFPRDAISSPKPGWTMGAFVVQSSTTVSYPLYTTDWAPDDAQPCGCGYTFRLGIAPQVPISKPAAPSAKPSAAPEPSASAGGQASSPGPSQGPKPVAEAEASAGESPGKASALPGVDAAVLLVAAAAVGGALGRRRPPAA